MYLNPFIAGIIMTISLELLIIVTLAVTANIKNKGGKK